MSGLVRAAAGLVCGLVLTACAAAQPAGVGEKPDAPDREDRGELRSLDLGTGDAWRGRGISYGPHRAGQSPWGVQPTREQIAEDMRILDPHFDMIRMYGAGEAVRFALETIRDEDLSLRVMVGAWLDSDTRLDPTLADADNPDGVRVPDIDARLVNREQVAMAIEIANKFPDIVMAVNIANETQIWWTGHPVARERLIEHLRWARERTSVPVTTADDFNFWNKPESKEVAAVCDFIGLHAYAMWNGQQLDDAMEWTAEQIEAVRALHPELPIVLCESGWATSVHTEGIEAELIKGRPGEAEQARFVRTFQSFMHERQMGYFLFEAFDEPWKGPDHPNAVEKHWGLWFESREPKEAVGVLAQ